MAREAQRAIRSADELIRGWRTFQFDDVPLVIASDDWALLFFGGPSHGFVPLRGRECPCWRRGGFWVARGSHDNYWILEGTGAEWETEDGWTAAAYRFQPGALVARVEAADESASWHRAIRDRFDDDDALGPTVVESPLPDQRARGWLLLEQRVLAEALRSTGAKRAAMLRFWAGVRKRLAKRHLLSDREKGVQLRSGFPLHFELAVLRRTDGWTRGQAEERLARVLDGGGRDLWPERWFGAERSRYVGAALWKIVEDMDAAWAFPKEGNSGPPGIETLPDVTRVPGREKARRSDFWEELAQGDWMVTTFSLVLNGTGAASRQLEAQAYAEIETIDRGYQVLSTDWRFSKPEWWKWEEQWNLSDIAAVSVRDGVRLVGAVHDRAHGEAVLLFGDRAASLLKRLHEGKNRYVALPQVQVRARRATIARISPKRWRIELPLDPEHEFPW